MLSAAPSGGGGIPGQPCIIASTAVTALMLMMPRTVVVGSKTCAGLATPSRTGPIVTPWLDTTRKQLMVMFAASRFGMISRFASPLSLVFGNTRSRTTRDSAASPCISPSTSSSGARCHRISAA